MIFEDYIKIGEFAASGAFEDTSKSLFCRKALGIRRYYENCKLYKYDKKPLYPSGVLDDDMIIRPHYLNGLDIDWCKVNEKNENLIKEYQNVFCKYSSKVPDEHAVAGNMFCHSMPNYGRIIREGLDAYAERIKQIKDADFREGLLHV